MRSASVKSGFVSDNELTETQFIEKYMAFGIYTEQYLQLRWKWMHLKKGDDRDKLISEMHKAYTQTEAYRINTGKKGDGNAKV